MSVKKIEDFLGAYEDLWQKINEYGPPLPCMDAVGEYVNDNDYYGYNITGEYDVFRLFFLGSSDYFPAICNIKNKRKADQYPVYMIYADTGELEYVGNFRKYIRTILRWALKKKELANERTEIEAAYEAAAEFSTETIFVKYELKSNN